MCQSLLRRRQIFMIFDPNPLPSAFQQNAYEGDHSISTLGRQIKPRKGEEKIWLTNTRLSEKEKTNWCQFLKDLSPMCISPGVSSQKVRTARPIYSQQQQQPTFFVEWIDLLTNSWSPTFICHFSLQKRQKIFLSPNCFFTKFNNGMLQFWFGVVSEHQISKNII